VLADRAGLSPRQFSRRFKSAYQATPAAFVETLRLDEARRRLSLGENAITNLAASVGFGSADAFRRAFERRLNITPSSYRRHFRLRLTGQQQTRTGNAS
jgi:transcriptional regulator GlxA family with amidase domain